jgi:hypothetical protein
MQNMEYLTIISGSNSTTLTVATEIGLLSYLYSLELTGFDLDAIPTELGRLTSLLTLTLTTSGVTPTTVLTIPTEFRMLQQLSRLTLNNFRLANSTAIPVGVFNDMGVFNNMGFRLTIDNVSPPQNIFDVIDGLNIFSATIQPATGELPSELSIVIVRVTHERKAQEKANKLFLILFFNFITVRFHSWLSSRFNSQMY